MKEIKTHSIDLRGAEFDQIFLVLVFLRFYLFLIFCSKFNDSLFSILYFYSIRQVWVASRVSFFWERRMLVVHGPLHDCVPHSALSSQYRIWFWCGQDIDTPRIVNNANRSNCRGPHADWTHAHDAPIVFGNSYSFGRLVEYLEWEKRIFGITSLFVVESYSRVRFLLQNEKESKFEWMHEQFVYLLIYLDFNWKNFYVDSVS